MLHAIPWPDGYAPGTTDNFMSDELVIPNLSAADVWPHIIDTSAWERYYGYISNVVIEDGAGPLLHPQARFRFSTMVFVVAANVTCFQPPSNGGPGRLAWHGRIAMSDGPSLDLHHAWLFEDVADGARILTQETQNGDLAREVAAVPSHPMHYAHQDWVKGLATTALRAQHERVGQQ